MLLVFGSTCHHPKPECLIFPGIFKTFQVLIYIFLPGVFSGSALSACRFFMKFSKDYLHNEPQVL